MAENVTNKSSLLVFDCSVLPLFIIHYLNFFLISLTANSVLIWIFYKNKTLLYRENILIFALAIVNLIGTLVEFPLVSISALNVCSENM